MQLIWTQTLLVLEHLELGSEPFHLLLQLAGLVSDWVLVNPVLKIVGILVDFLELVESKIRVALVVLVRIQGTHHLAQLELELRALGFSLLQLEL